MIDIITNILHHEMLHMWVMFALVCVTIVLYAIDKFPSEIVSLGILCSLLLFFHFFPYVNAQGVVFNPESLLKGFSNPALVAVMSLLVLGQAVVNTGSLASMTGIIVKICGKYKAISVMMTLTGVVLASAFVNDTPTCVIFIPIMLMVANKLNYSASKVMIPLSYASILGGTTVLVGSSTNLLVSGSIKTLGLEPLGMFDFTLQGVIIAVVGLLYIAFILPRLLPDRAPFSSDIVKDKSRQFIVQLEVGIDSELIGKSLSDAEIFGVEDVRVKMLQRHEHAYLTPFDNSISILAHDVIVISTTKESLLKLIAEGDKRIFGRIASLNAKVAEESNKSEDNLALSEILITPASRIIGQSIEQIGFYHNYHCTVLGVQRRSRMITTRMTENRLASGDVLLVMGTKEHIEEIGDDDDFMLMEGSTQELPSRRNSFKVNVIFGAVIASAAFGIVPIHIGALTGAIAVIMVRCLNVRQALRALDGQIIMLVAAGMAIATALQVTGGAAYLANSLIDIMAGMDAIWVMSALFGLMAISTNILSNNATALIFTPIAVNTAIKLNAPPEMFIYAVIFASNCCSFASPIGYQTNLLVMGPGHYKFIDYLKAGLPLIFIVWATYTLFSYFYY